MITNAPPSPTNAPSAPANAPIENRTESVFSCDGIEMGAIVGVADNFLRCTQMGTFDSLKDCRRQMRMCIVKLCYADKFNLSIASSDEWYIGT